MSGETALARQLKKLAVPQTTVLIQDKIRKSFLFDHRDAAGLDRDLIFAYGTNGLEKLCILNRSFSKFDANLFSLSYKDFERSVQSKDVNRKLDEKISDFLKLLSPYFLIRAAHEALEWLIYRFHIHMYNVDDLIASVLPYYNTSTFVRVVQLLDLNDRSRWYWLKPVQKSGVPLDYSAVLNCFISDGGFRKFVCNIGPNVFAAYKQTPDVAVPMISFSMVTIYNALIKCDSINDKLLTMLFPFILEGLTSDVNKYIAAAYLVIAEIVVKIKLSPQTVRDLLIRVFQSVKKDIIKEAFYVLLLVYQNQSIKSLPSVVYSAIISNEESILVFSFLSDTFENFPLIQGFIKKSISVLFTNSCTTKKKNRKSLRFLKKFKYFLKEVKLNEKSVKLCFKLMLRKYTKTKVTNKTRPYFIKIVTSVLKCLENRYPEFFDKAHRSFLEKESNSNNIDLCNLINDSVCSVKYKILPDAKTSLVLGLNHASAQVRQTSATYLLQFLSSQDVVTERAFLENSLYERLFDENPKVVLEILSAPRSVLHMLDKSKVLSACESIFKNNINLKSEWYPIMMKCLNIIANYFNDKESEISILPIISEFIFPLSEHTIEGFNYLIKCGTQNTLIKELKNISNICKNYSDKIYYKMNCMVIESIKRFVEKLDQNSKKALATFMKSKIVDYRSNAFLAFYIFTLKFMIIQKNDSNVVKYVDDLLDVFRFSLSLPNIYFEKYRNESECMIIKKSFMLLKENVFPTLFIFHVLKNIITEIKVEFDSKTWPDINTESYKILTSIYDFCIFHLNSHTEKRCLEYFKCKISLLISHQFKSIRNTFRFLCTKWTDYNENIPYIIQLASINIATVFIKAENVQLDWLFDDDAVFICMLKAVADSNIDISNAALNLFSKSLACARTSEHPFKFIAEEICTKSEEIKIDYRQCFDTVGNCIKPVAEHINLNNLDTDLLTRKLILDKVLNLLSQEIPYSIKHFLLLCLQNVDSVLILSAYIPVMCNVLIILEETPENSKQLLPLINLLLQKFTPKTATILEDKSAESKALLDCLKLATKYENEQEQSVQLLTLKVLSNEFFAAIPSAKVQQEIFEVLLEFYMISRTNVNTKVEKVLRKLSTYAFLFLKHFQDKELSVSKGTTLREAKKSRLNECSDSTFDTFEKGAWKKMTVFLEIIQNKSKLLKKEIVVPELFNLLNKTLNFDSQAPVEYIRQLILSALHSCCQQLGTGELEERQFQVELIVQCIRSSTNAKTHKQSLLLLNLAARMFPDYVLGNVMSIFIFMGSSLVRQDDSYSFQVISQTIETIVPSLLEASNRQTETEGFQVVASVIRVFVDSLSDIPGHRQLPLFTKLVSTLDPSKYLWIPLGQICDQYATVFHDITADDSKNCKISPTLEFAVTLHKQFSPDIQIDTCIKLVDLLSTLPDTKQQIDSNPDLYRKIKEPFNISNHDDKQLQIYKQNVLSYMKIWLSSQEFLNQVSELSIKEQSNLEEKYELLLESILSFLQERLNTKQSKDKIRNLCSQVQLLYHIVYAINTLLPCHLFIKVIKNLIMHNEIEIQIKAIELLNTKLEEQQDLVLKENHKALQKLLRPLLKLINKCLIEGSADHKHSVIQQTSLYSLHLLCKLIGSEYPTKFYKVLNISVTILSKYTQPELIVNALLCLAQLCRCLNVDVLPHLNSFMPVIVNILQDKKVLNMNECLVLGVITALQSIIENLGMFLSSYMEAVLTGICMFSVRYSELGKKAISEKFENLQNKIANEIALRVVLTAVECSYIKLSPENVRIIIPLMKILTEKINSSNYEDILSASHQLETFYLTLLNFRNLNSDSSDLDTIEEAECNIISSFEVFVMKLSVTRFRTLFQKVYQWAITTNEDQEQKLRVYTFYKLTSKFSKSLKSLFAHMSKYFFRHVATILDLNNITKSKASYFGGSILSRKLLINAIDTLNHCFMHAEEQFLDKENFDLLMQPLVAQIENLDDEMVYQDLIDNHLSSCIAYFMAAVSDNALWKALNYQILLKTRHDSPKVRFGTLQVLQEVVNRMGDNYLVLLPESIPFLAEIMEDESIEVEQECQNVIIKMEKILGEPIRKYF